MGLLCGACVLARKRNRLRVAFGSALVCSLLLAIVLFPAISMTDDLQRVNLEAEVGLRSTVALLDASLAEPADLACRLAVTVVLAAILAMGVRLLARMAMVQTRQDRLPMRVRWYRPAAVRPPTLPAIG